MDPRVDLAHNRTAMANYRTQLAMDRTALAWIRTSLTFATFGLGMVGFTRSAMMQSDQPGQQELHRAAIGFGGALVLIGITAMVLSSISYWKALKRSPQRTASANDLAT